MPAASANRNVPCRGIGSPRGSLALDSFSRFIFTLIFYTLFLLDKEIKTCVVAWNPVGHLKSAKGENKKQVFLVFWVRFFFRFFIGFSLFGVTARRRMIWWRSSTTMGAWRNIVRTNVADHPRQCLWNHRISKTVGEHHRALIAHPLYIGKQNALCLRSMLTTIITTTVRETSGLSLALLLAAMSTMLVRMGDFMFLWCEGCEV